MRTGHASVIIARAPETVFDFMLDVTRAHEWRYLLTRMEQVSDEPMSAGSRVRIHFQSGDRKYVQEITLAECVRPRLQTWVNDAHDDFRLAVTFTLAGEGGGTRVTVDADTQGKRLSTKLLVPLVGRSHRERFSNTLDRLKLAVER
jgi:uncharacterized protein YndB with AHSA1/START domain